MKNVYTDYTSILEALPEDLALNPWLKWWAIEVEWISQKKVNSLLENGFLYHYIEDTLLEQREKRTSVWLTTDIYSYDKSMRQRILGKASLYNLMREAFCLPEDARQVPRPDLTPEQIHTLPASLVIQPEYIPDSLMVGLWFMSESEARKMFDGEKIERKIEKIEAIKDIFTHTIPLSLADGTTTARISCIHKPWDPNDGKYIVFQELSHLVDGKKVTNIKVSVYGDVLSVIRSQRYAFDTLGSTGESLQGIRDEDLTPLIEMRGGWDPSDTAYSIISVVEKLSWRRGYEVERAESRLRWVDFHPERDQLRMMWARNDLKTAVREKSGKKKEILSQVERLSDMERFERWRFLAFYKHVTRDLSRFSELLDQKSEFQSLGQFLTSNSEMSAALEMILKRMSDYNTHLWQSFLPLLGHPYHTIPEIFSRNISNLKDKAVIDEVTFKKFIDFFWEIQLVAGEIMTLEREHYESLESKDIKIISPEQRDRIDHQKVQEESTGDLLEKLSEIA